MSSNDDKAHKTATSIYKDAMGDFDVKPDYNRFLDFALNKQQRTKGFAKGDEDLVKKLLEQGIEKLFDKNNPNAKEDVMKLLASHLEKQQSKEKSPITPSTWAERVKSEKASKSQDLDRKK